jgi:hypothetical protein
MGKVLGMGNALVDILLKLDNDLVLEQLALPKGSMQLVDMHTANNVIALLATMAAAKPPAVRPPIPFTDWPVWAYRPAFWARWARMNGAPSSERTWN